MSQLPQATTSAIGGLIGGAVGGLTGAGTWLRAVTARSADRRAAHDRVLSLISESAQEPLAVDRHAVGSVLHRSRPAACGSHCSGPKAVTLTDDQVASLFRVLWYFERVDALHHSLEREGQRRHAPLRTLLLQSLRNAIETWSEYACSKCYTLDGIGQGSDTAARPVDLGGETGSARAVKHLRQQLHALDNPPRGTRRRWSRPPAGESGGCSTTNDDHFHRAFHMGKH